MYYAMPRSSPARSHRPSRIFPRSLRADNELKSNWSYNNLPFVSYAKTLFTTVVSQMAFEMVELY